MKFVAASFFLALTAGLCFSAKAVSDLRKQVADLENKIASVELSRPASPAAPATDAGPTSSGASTASRDPKSPDITDAAPGATEPGEKKVASHKSKGGSDSPPVTTNPATWTDADREAFDKEVLAVLDKQQKERQDKQEAKQAEWISARLKEQLKLTDQQVEQIGKVISETQDKVGELRSTITPENRDEVRPQIQAAMQAADTQVKSYLTAEQATAYDEMKKQQGGMFGFGGGGGDRGGRRRMGGNDNNGEQPQ